MKLFGYCAAIMVALFLGQTAVAEEDAPDLKACWSAFPVFEEEEQRVRSAGFDYDNPSDRMKYFEGELSDPDTACGNRIVALYQLTYLQFEHGSAEDYFSALRRTLSDPLYRIPEARVLTETLISGGVIYSLSKARVEEGYQVLKDEAALLSTPAMKYRGFFALFLVQAGQFQSGESMAVRLFLDLGGARELTLQERIVYPGIDPSLQSQLGFALRALVISGAHDQVIDSLTRMRVYDSSPDMKLLALSSVPRATDPAAALARLSENILDMEQTIEKGYMSPEGQRWFHAAHILALRASARQTESDELLARARSQFGEQFNAEEEVAVAFEELLVLKSRDNLMDNEDAQLAAPIQPRWPWEVSPPAFANCLVRFNVSEKGKPMNISGICDDDRFLKSAENAISRAEFVPKKKDGKPEIRYNVVQPLEYRS